MHKAMQLSDTSLDLICHEKISDVSQDAEKPVSTGRNSLDTEGLADKLIIEQIVSVQIPQFL